LLRPILKEDWKATISSRLESNNKTAVPNCKSLSKIERFGKIQLPGCVQTSKKKWTLSSRTPALRRTCSSVPGAEALSSSTEQMLLNSARCRLPSAPRRITS